ncbi:cytochrome b/b6 domain-containing protein [Paracoccaceae bacterium]|jgi:cytochrome b561|nr:cytochrome b/b6 domain-containing protein [Paracoccaceae bacterium]
MEPKKVLDVGVQYSELAKVFHWGFVALFAYGITKQVDDISQLEDFALLRFELIFATIMILLLAIRFLYMAKTQTSSLPKETSAFQRLAAKLVHLGMYVLLATIAVSGILIGGIYWIGMKDGLLIEGIIAVHELAVTASYWLIGVHVAAALFHRLKQDGVWSSMVPIWKEVDNKNNE